MITANRTIKFRLCFWNLQQRKWSAGQRKKNKQYCQCVCLLCFFFFGGGAACFSHFTSFIFTLGASPGSYYYPIFLGRKLWLSLLWLGHMHKQCKEGVDCESAATTGQSDRTGLLQMSWAQPLRTLGCWANGTHAKYSHCMGGCELRGDLSNCWSPPETKRWVGNLFFKKEERFQTPKMVQSLSPVSPEGAMRGFSNGMVREYE